MRVCIFCTQCACKKYGTGFGAYAAGRRGDLGMLGIDDPLVLTAYLLCILSTVFCIVFGAMRWNKGDEPVEQADQRWAAEQDKAEEDL